mmetsp:Transcript_57637/g.95288  ORF Transcript_57637/g.95288 Transcript_57637/m.95288 type:complete len:504 (+) Transcript_57637:42-1553(+)
MRVALMRRYTFAISQRAWKRVGSPAFRPRYCSGRTHSGFDLAVVDEPVMWPLYAGGVLAFGVMTAGIFAKRDRLLARAQAYVDAGPTVGGLTSETASFQQIGGLMLAFSLTQVPVEELKLKMLACGALEHWTKLVGCFDLDMQQIALGALTALLEGEATLRMFRKQSSWYEALEQAMPSLLHSSPEGMSPLSDPEILRDTLKLGCILATHPLYAHKQGDAWLWDKLLEQASFGLDWDTSAALYWGCIASAASDKPVVASQILSNPVIKRWLVHLADAEERFDASSFFDSGGLSAPTTSSVDQRESVTRDYARAALHRLAQVAELQDTTSMSEEELQEWEEPFFHEYLHCDIPSPPPLPPPEACLISSEEILIDQISAVSACTLGGVLWGAVRGSFRSARARRSVGRSVLMTAAGACCFETLLQCKAILRDRFRSSSGSPPPLHKSIFSFTSLTALELIVSCQFLWLLIQPSRAPFTFGGWLSGRVASTIWDLIDLEVEYGELD